MFFKYFGDIETFLPGIYHIVTQYMEEIKVDPGRAAGQHSGVRKAETFLLHIPLLFVESLSNHKVAQKSRKPLDSMISKVF